MSTARNPGGPIAGAVGFGQDLRASVAATVLLTVLCCGIYPLAVWGLAQLLFPVQANGSLVRRDGRYTIRPGEAVGSALLGQGFGHRAYFHPRPSAAGGGYDAANSSGTNLGPLSDKLINGIHGSKKADGAPDPTSDFEGVKDLAAAYRRENGLSAGATIPADAVTRSGSGLDPHISPQNAALQAARVAGARGISEAEVRGLIEAHTEGPGLGFLGERGVNVLRLNLALDARTGAPAAP